MQAIYYQQISAPLLFRFDFPKRSKERSEIEIVSDKVKSVVQEYATSPLSAELFFNERIADFFDFRMAALRWLVENKIDIENFPVVMAEMIEELRSNSESGTLAENVEFAVRANVRGIRKVLPEEAAFLLSGENGFSFSEMAPIPKISWQDYVTLFVQSAPVPVASLMMDWVMASLAIEFAVVTALFFAEKEIKLSKQKVDDLSGFAASAGQEFGAVSREFAALIHPSERVLMAAPHSEAEKAEQLTLAEAGIGEYAAQLPSYE